MSDNKTDLLLEKFSNAIKKNRLSHLYLISGYKGSGKKKLAYNLAGLLLDANPKTLEKGHINLSYIKPEGQTIKIEQIENLQLEFSKTSLVKGYRVFIIDQVDKLGISSANRLLKFLEEPTNKKTIGFLLTSNKQAVITTILSRAQTFHLASLSEESLKEMLLEKGIEKLKAELLPFLSKDIDELLLMSEDVNLDFLVNEFAKFSEKLSTEDNLWLYAEKNLKDIRYNKELVNYFLQFLLAFYLDVIKYKNNQPVSFSTFTPTYQILEEENIELIEEKLKIIQELLQKINYNVNIDMAFSQLLLKLG